MISCLLLLLGTFAFNVYVGSAYYCVVIEDEIPSPFSEQHCIQKVQNLLSKRRAFSVEIAASNEQLVSEMTKVMSMEPEGPMIRALSSFIGESLKQTATTSITTAFGYCLWNIVDNLRREKLLDFREWVQDILVCGNSFDWKEMLTQSAVWGAASGVTHGGFKGLVELSIVSWTYAPSHS